jgi:hypothetical protein
MKFVIGPDKVYFFILMTFSNLTFQKIFVGGKDPSTLALHGINSDSAANYQLKDVESTVRMGFPPGITSSWTRNPPEEYDSARYNHLMQADSDRQDQYVRKILKAVAISGSASTNHIYCEVELV